MRLGPLEQVDGCWGMGDRRPGGTWLEFRADGLYRHVPGSEGELVPWARVMEFMRVTFGGKYPRQWMTLTGMLGGMPGPWKGHGGGYLQLTLRHPHEPWAGRFDRHPRWYTGTEIVLLQTLLAQTVEAGEAHRLGDADWLGHVVTRLASGKPRTARQFSEAVTAARTA